MALEAPAHATNVPFMHISCTVLSGGGGGGTYASKDPRAAKISIVVQITIAREGPIYLSVMSTLNSWFKMHGSDSISVAFMQYTAHA